MPDSTPARPSVCGERAYLLSHLVPAVLAYAPAGAAEPEDVEQHLRCTLQAHTAGDHHALIMELPATGPGASPGTSPSPGTGALWARGHHPATITARPDCPATDPTTAEPCCEYAGHPGRHCYELNDPWLTRTATQCPPTSG